ncbi:MAG: radical SAM-associated putative lipoprotein [Bacteroidales bacterium]|nr:radical SAM-associated putative lipoprotein [Bacteroidales bacterium]
MKRLFEKFIMGLLALLGFSVTESCRVEYGCPHANYAITGEVTSEENVKLSGIRVTVSLDGDWERDPQYGYITTETNADGQYETHVNAYIWSSETAVKFEDVDGPENGGPFKTKIVTVDPENLKQIGKGDGNWFDGDWVATVNAVLEKEEN